MDNDRFVLPTTVRNRRANKGAGRGLQAGLGCLVLLFLYLFLAPALRLVEREAGVLDDGAAPVAAVAAAAAAAAAAVASDTDAAGLAAAAAGDILAEPVPAGAADAPQDAAVPAPVGGARGAADDGAAVAAAVAAPTTAEPTSATVDDPPSEADLARGWRAHSTSGGGAAWVRGMSPAGAAALLSSGSGSGKEGGGAATFACSQGGTAKQLPFRALNDDYCDCDDGVDEVGTAACASSTSGGGGSRGRFWCGGVPAAARKLMAAVTIPTARVNDGVCDCCDGSDEWARVRRWHAAEGAVAGGGGGGGGGDGGSGPCPNTCEELAKGALARAAALAQGSAARRSLEATGAAMRARGDPAHPSDAGVRDAFLPLIAECFQLFDEGYRYELCPFRSAGQQDRGHSVDLGSSFRWDDVKPDPGLAGEALLAGSNGMERTMLLEGGEACPSGVRRSVRVHFSCAEENKLTHITEPQSCSYSFFLSTPAACP